MPGPDLSVVVPLLDEEANVAPLVAAVVSALGDTVAWELILVDDGSRDQTAAIAAQCGVDEGRVRLVRLARSYGQTAALQAGFDQARGRVIVSMDGDLQSDPADIPRLVAALEQGFDVVAGYRAPRAERSLLRRVPSAAANWLIRALTGVPARDSGCTLRAYRREVVQVLHLYSDMHRFIPALAVGLAGAHMSQIPVRSRPRRSGRSKYGLARAPGVLADLLTLTLLHSFRERPLALFITGAAAAMVLAGVVLVAAERTTSPGYVLTGTALAWVGLACYLVMLGLIGQVLVHLRSRRGSAHRTVSLRERTL